MTSGKGIEQRLAGQLSDLAPGSMFEGSVPHHDRISGGMGEWVCQETCQETCGRCWSRGTEPRASRLAVVYTPSKSLVGLGSLGFRVSLEALQRDLVQQRVCEGLCVGIDPEPREGKGQMWRTLQRGGSGWPNEQACCLSALSDTVGEGSRGSGY